MVEYWTPGIVEQNHVILNKNLWMWFVDTPTGNGWSKFSCCWGKTDWMSGCFFIIERKSIVVYSLTYGWVISNWMLVFKSNVQFTHCFSCTGMELVKCMLEDTLKKKKNFDFWNLEFGIWNLEFGIFDFWLWYFWPHGFFIKTIFHQFYPKKTEKPFSLIGWEKYGRPMKPFFNNIPNFWANWADWPNKFWVE